MTIKNLLLHMANDETYDQRLELATRLARKHDARLRICYFTLPQTMPAAVMGRGASYAYIAEATAIAREKAEALQQEIAKECEGIDWVLETLEEDHVEAMARRTYLADLAIVSQTDPKANAGRISLHLPDELTLGTACSVLVRPHSPTVKFAGKNLVVAWKRTRESSRAMRDSLGLLQDAENVTVVCLAHHEREAEATEQSEKVCTFLKNHGVKATSKVEEVAAGKGFGETLLEISSGVDADGIVMGAYSHSRFRERVLGGMTRYMLENTTIPLIMSH